MPFSQFLLASRIDKTHKRKSNEMRNKSETNEKDLDARNKRKAYCQNERKLNDFAQSDTDLRNSI